MHTPSPDCPKKLGNAPYIHPTASVENAYLHGWTEVGARSSIIESTLGDYSYVTNDCEIIYTEIAKFCSIAAHCRINPGNHPLQRAALHHFTYRSNLFDLGEDDAAFFDWRRSFPVSLGNDVWLGHGAIVMPGITIGDGAVVGAGAVVSRDVAPFMIVAGVPAVVVRPRFPQWVMDALQRIRWWDWSHEVLKERMADFRSLEADDFACKYDQHLQPG